MCDKAVMILDAKTLNDSRPSELLNETRAEILNVLQAVVPSDKWDYIRSRILKALGRNGLEGKLEILLKRNGPTHGTENFDGDCIEIKQ